MPMPPPRFNAGHEALAGRQKASQNRAENSRPCLLDWNSGELPADFAIGLKLALHFNIASG